MERLAKIKRTNVLTLPPIKQAETSMQKVPSVASLSKEKKQVRSNTELKVMVKDASKRSMEVYSPRI